MRHVSDQLYRNFACLLSNGVIAPPQKKKILPAPLSESELSSSSNVSKQCGAGGPESTSEHFVSNIT